MAIRGRQVGWSQKSNLLWQILKQVSNLTKQFSVKCPIPSPTSTKSGTIPPRQIGWSNEAELLWEISRELNRTIAVANNCSNTTTTTTTTTAIPTWLLYVAPQINNICFQDPGALFTLYTNETELNVGVQLYTDPELTIGFQGKKGRRVGIGTPGSPVWSISVEGLISSQFTTC